MWCHLVCLDPKGEGLMYGRMCLFWFLLISEVLVRSQIVGGLKMYFILIV